MHLQLIQSIQSVIFLHNYWFWISLVEFIIILLLALKYRKTKKSNFSSIDEHFINSSKYAAFDMENVVNSISKSKTLYDELKKKCHPDRFMDGEKNEIANEIYQEITKFKHNYKELLRLRMKAEDKLKIKI